MSHSLMCYCACSILVRGALGMTILTTAEKFEFLSSHGVRSTKSCSGPSKSPAISGKPGALLTSGSVRIVRSCFFRCYYYFVSAVFVVQCISVLSGAGFGCMIESVTIKWVTGSSKLTLYRQRFSLRKTHFLPLKRFLKCYGAKCH